MIDRILSQSSFSHLIDVPIECIDIADWLFNLPEAEYQRCCPPDHIAAGATSTERPADVDQRRDDRRNPDDPTLHRRNHGASSLLVRSSSGKITRRQNGIPRGKEHSDKIATPPISATPGIPKLQ
jgi:hypothetical protein